MANGRRSRSVHMVNSHDSARQTDYGLIPFLASLTPGMGVVLQYACQPPAFGIFQGFQDGLVIVSNFDKFPGLTRIVASRINAVAPVSWSPYGPQSGYGGGMSDLGRCGCYW